MDDAATVSLGGETFKGLLAKFTMALGGLAGTVLFARILGPTAFGGFYLLFTVVKIIDRPVSGWAEAGKKRFAEAGASAPAVVGAQLLFYAGWTLAGVAGALAFTPLLRRYTGLDEAFAMFVALLVALALYEAVERLVQARGLLGVTTWIDALRSYLTLGLQLVLVLAGLGAAGMAFGLSLASVLSVPFLAYYLGVSPVLPSMATLRSFAAYARFSIPFEALNTAYDQLDKLVLGVLLVPAAVANFQVALVLTLPAMFVADVAGSGLMARVSVLESRAEDASEDVSNTLAFASVLSIPVLFGAAALAEPLVVTFYGPDYAAAAPLLVGLAVYRVIRTQSHVLSHTVRGLDRPDGDLAAVAIALVLNAALGVALVIEVGAVGVVIAFAVAEAVRYLALARLVGRELPAVTLLPRTLVAQLGAAVLMFVVVLLLHRTVPVRSWLHLAVLVGTGAAVYVGALVAGSSRHRSTAAAAMEDVGYGHLVPDRWRP